MKAGEHFQEVPYWLDPRPLVKSFAVTKLPSKTQVLVIGSGYTGTTAAIRLRQAGIEVVLIDMDKAGTAASARNGGMTLTGLSEGLATMEKKLGPEMVARLFAESIASVKVVEDLVAEGRIECNFQRCGHLETAFKPAHFENLKREQERLQTRYDHETQIITAADLKSEINSSLYHGALLDPISAGIHPARYVAGLITMADRLGVDIYENTTAQAIERRGAGFFVRTNRGNLTADDVIVATNGYTGRLTPWIRQRLVSTESLMIATEKLPVQLAKSLIPKGRMVYDTKIFLFYFRLSPDGRRLLFGGRPKSPRLSLRDNAAYMYRDMLSVYPQLKDVHLDYAWTGKLGFTWNRCPHIGRHNGIYYALGYCGHGVALATYLGEKLAEMVQHKGAKTVFAELPLRAIPFYTVNQWFLPFLSFYFSMLDRFF